MRGVESVITLCSHPLLLFPPEDNTTAIAPPMIASMNKLIRIVCPKSLSMTKE